MEEDVTYVHVCFYAMFLSDINCGGNSHFMFFFLFCCLYFFLICFFFYILTFVFFRQPSFSVSWHTKAERSRLYLLYIQCWHKESTHNISKQM